MKKKREWYIYLEDYDKKLYTVIGPFSDDDSHWIDSIQNQIDSGRNLQWQYAEPGQLGEIPEHAKGNDLEEADSSSILQSPQDKSSHYIGHLPQYAQAADRSKLVKILCKGKCGQVRWAELNKSYPGKMVLKEAEMNIYKAKCLKCGKIAIDNYNWSRP